MNTPTTSTNRLTSPAVRALRRRVIAQIRQENLYLRDLPDQQALDQYIETETNTYRLDVLMWQSITECDRLLGEAPSEPRPVPPDLLVRAFRVESHGTPRHFYALAALTLTQETRSLQLEIDRLEEQDHERATLYATVPHHHPARSN